MPLNMGSARQNASHQSEEERKASSIALLRRKAREYVRGVGILNMFLKPRQYDEEPVDDEAPSP